MNIDIGIIIFSAAMLFLDGVTIRDIYKESRKKDKYGNIREVDGKKTMLGSE